MFTSELLQLVFIWVVNWLFAARVCVNFWLFLHRGNGGLLSQEPLFLVNSMALGLLSRRQMVLRRWIIISMRRPKAPRASLWWDKIKKLLLCFLTVPSQLRILIRFSSYIDYECPILNLFQPLFNLNDALVFFFLYFVNFLVYLSYFILQKLQLSSKKLALFVLGRIILHFFLYKDLSRFLPIEFLVILNFRIVQLVTIFGFRLL